MVKQVETFYRPREHFDFGQGWTYVEDMSNGPGPGSSGNVIAAVCSFFIPGLGQLVQGRLFIALIQFVLAGVLWIFFLGWLIHIWSVIDAALYRG